jgi:asparagine synthase (glutamine-hydrolysing)
MLGTSLICDFAGRPSRGENDPSLGMETNSFPGVNRHMVWQDRYSQLSYTSNGYYPVFGCENDDVLIHMEGRVYNIQDSRLAEELLQLAQRLFHDTNNVASLLARWLLGADGDFLMVMINKADCKMVLFNDVFGRLPTYFHLQDELLIVSRSLGFITAVLGTATFDRMALAQYLLLGFPLGKKTWFTGIQYLEPASLITISQADSSIKVTKLHEFNLDGEEHSRRSPAEHAHNLATLFREACQRRAGEAGKIVVSLSGGLDSRAVAAGLRGEGIPFTTASFLDHHRSNAADIEAASRVAQLLGVEWQLFPLPPPRGIDVVRLLVIKRGANNLRMSFILTFFHQLQERFGPEMTYFTGDGGGDVLGDSWPYRRVDTQDTLVDYLIERYQVWSLDEVAALTQLSGKDIKATIGAHLDSYPETATDRKYKHFFCLEVATKMYHEGEDRNRYFFWSISPFYSLDFFNYALNCPDRDKKEYRLYREFLGKLHPSLCSIDYANWQTPVTSIKFRWLYRIKCLTRARPNLVRSLRKLFKRYDLVEPASNILECLRDQRSTCNPIGHYLDSRVLSRVLERPQDYDKIQLWTLFTLTSTISEFTCPRPIGEEFLDRDFV